MIFRSRLAKILFQPVALCDHLLKGGRARRAQRYLEACGVSEFLIGGDATEHKPVWIDLVVLHRQVRRTKPRHVLEFGIGYSTVVLAHALQMNHREAGGGDDAMPTLHCIDASEHWIDNAMQRVPDSLKPYLQVHFERVHAAEHNGDLCHFYDKLPDINPGLIYLDGPSNLSVEGDVRGLRFTDGKGTRIRPVLSADVLLYEGALAMGTTIIVDGRTPNTRFLRRHLKRRWSFRPNFAERRFTFSLRD